MTRTATPAKIPTAQELGARIKKARSRRKLTQREVIELTGINRGTYYALERGAVFPRLGHLIDIHRALCTRPGELIAL